MRPVHFVCTCLMLASTLALAQSNPSSFNQNHPVSASRYGQSVPYRQHAGRQATMHPNASPQGLSFAKPVSYGTGGTGTIAIAIGDLNGDGVPDLVVTSCANTGCTGTGLISVLLGGTAMEPSKPLSPILPADRPPSRLPSRT